MIVLSEFELAGALTSQAKLSITDAGVTTYTIPAGKLGVTFQNQGTGAVWYGSSDISPANNKGVYLLPNQTLTFKSVKRTFTISFITAAGVTGTIGVNEVD